MKKRTVLVSILTLVILVGIGAILSLRQQRAGKQNPTSPAVSQKEELAVWEDQAGFTFQYPKDVLVNKHDEDTENYAHIEMTSSAHPVKLIVWAKDTTYADIAAWVKKDKALTGAVSVDTTLGGQPAKKIILTTPSKKIIIGTISDQILFTIESEPSENDEYWIKVSDTIVPSFAFTPMPTDASAGSTTSQDTGSSVDEEEVVE